MQVNAGEFIGQLRERLALKLDGESDVLQAFDRACVEVLVEERLPQKTRVIRRRRKPNGYIPVGQAVEVEDGE